MNDSNRENRRLEKLSKKSAVAAGILTFLAVPVGYIYTGRYRALLKMLGVALVLTAFLSILEPNRAENERYRFSWVGYSFGMLAALENTYAVRKAKCDRILKLAKDRGDITVSDCALETGIDLDRIILSLETLEQKGAIEVTGEKPDGSLVYHAV